MTALLTLYDRSKKKIGQCDAKCFAATSSQCRCICGGINHGVGRQKAAENALDMTVDHCTCETVAPGAQNLTLKKYRRLADFTHPTFWDVD